MSENTGGVDSSITAEVASGIDASETSTNESTPETTTEAVEATEATLETSETAEQTETPEATTETTETAQEQVEQLQDASEELGDAEQAEQEAKEEFEKALYKVKIDGQEKEVTQEELIRNYQAMRASQKKFEEASSYRKQAQRAFELLQTDTARVLKESGVDPRKFAEEYLAGVLEQEAMDPAECERYQLQQELEELRRFKQDQEQAAQQQKQAELGAVYAQDLKAKTEQATQNAGLPNSKVVISKIGQYMMDAIDKGWENVEPADVVSLVKEDLESDLKELLRSADDDKLANLVGDDTVKRLRKADVEKVRAAAPATPTNTKAVKQPEKPSSKAKSRKNISEYMRDLEKKFS